MSWTTVDKVAFVLVLVGALNWGLVGALHVDLVDKVTELVTKDNVHLNRAIYVLVGVAALWVAYRKLSKKQ
jgi:uncharacterized membrane protein YuzA (DUF378 family)